MMSQNKSCVTCAGSRGIESNEKPCQHKRGADLQLLKITLFNVRFGLLQRLTSYILVDKKLSSVRGICSVRSALTQ